MPEDLPKAQVVRFLVNGERRELLCEPHLSLLEVLRDRLGLTGAKEGCNNGNCGACNVLLDGRLVNSCVVLAVEVDGSSLITIEGIGSAEGLDPIQQKFLEHAALQCGICTPGFIVSAKALLDTNPEPTDHEIRWWLAGNLCRCTGYGNIVTAVRDAAATYMQRAQGERDSSQEPASHDALERSPR